MTQAASAGAAALRGHLPDRYTGEWRASYDARVRAALRPGMRVLDIGSGWKPSIPADERPPGCVWVGLDVSRAELERAPAASYDEVVVSDLRQHVADLDDSFDLVVGCQVLEHVRPLAPLVANVRAYLRPGGRFITFFSGTFSVYAMLNRILPRPASLWVMRTFLGRPADTMFPAYYDRCWAGAMQTMLAGWSAVDIVPSWRGAGYFVFSRPLQAAYIAYEEWARLAGHVNLSPYYLVDATS